MIYFLTRYSFDGQDRDRIGRLVCLRLFLWGKLLGYGMICCGLHARRWAGGLGLATVFEQHSNRIWTVVFESSFDKCNQQRALKKRLTVMKTSIAQINQKDSHDWKINTKNKIETENQEGFTCITHYPPPVEYEGGKLIYILLSTNQWLYCNFKN